jgi:hypothetical protein
MTSGGLDEAREGPATRITQSTEVPARWGEAKARLSRARKLVLMGGLLAGLIAFGIGEAIYDLIPVQRIQVTELMTNKALMVFTPETEIAAAARNAALAFGLLGACLGGFLGTAGGLARRSTSAAATAGFLGAVVASAWGAGISLGLLPYCLQAQADHPENDLIIALVMHGLIWGPVGAVAGLAFAVGLGERRVMVQSLAAGLAGALLGTVCFDLIGAALFSHAETANAISLTWPTRLMARLLVTTGTAVTLELIMAMPRDAVSAESG